MPSYNISWILTIPIRVFLTTQLFIHSIWTNSFATRRVGEGSGRKLVGNEYPRVVYICSRSWPLAVGSHERGYLVCTSASRPVVLGSNPIAAPKSDEVYPSASGFTPQLSKAQLYK